MTGAFSLPSPLGVVAPLGGPHFESIADVFLFDEVSSTNDVGKALVERMLADESDLLPTAVVALRQSEGRGRAGRTWRSFGTTSLAVTLIRPWPEGPERVRVPLVIGIHLARGLSALHGLDVRLKWPNDLLVGRAKLGGILVEARAHDGAGYAVIGVGLNVTTSSTALDAAGLHGATSLLLAGAPASRLQGDQPIRDVLSILDGALASPPPDLAQSFRAVSAHAEGDTLTVSEGGRSVSGAFFGVTADGFLRLRTAEGVETLVSGDVTVF